MYFYAENEVARLRHSKLLIMDEVCMAKERRGQRHLAKAALNDPTHTARGVHCTHSRMTDRWTPPKTVPAHGMHAGNLWSNLVKKGLHAMLECVSSWETFINESE